jgi:hypothetical protein
MPGITQRRCRLGGVDYDRGAVVPDEVVSDRTVAMGLVVRVAPDATVGAATLTDASDDDLLAEVERRKLLADEDSPAPTPADDDKGDLFDPTAHAIPDVLAHVDANPGDLDRVVDAELGAAKPRKRLLDELDRRMAERPKGEGDQSVGGNQGGSAEEE